MRVQRVVMPWDVVSWTVLDDDGSPVGAVDRFLGFLSSSEKSPNTVKSYPPCSVTRITTTDSWIRDTRGKQPCGSRQHSLRPRQRQEQNRTRLLPR